MATPHTTADTQEDTESVDEQEDKPTASREKKGVGRKILNSKAKRSLTGGKRLAGNAVTPAMDKNQSPSRVSVTTSRRQSNTMSAVQSRQAAAGREKPGKQQEEHYPILGQRDPPPQGPLFQPERPNTSPLVTSTAAEEHVVLKQSVLGHNSGQLNQPVGYGSNQPPHHLQPAHHGGDPPLSLAYDHLPLQVHVV